MKRAQLVVAALLLALVASSAKAGGPRAVNGLGQPMKWSTAGPVVYHPDQGTLGLLSNAEARELVAEAFAEWAAGPSDITFAEGTSLAQNVNAVGIPFTNAAHYKNFYRKTGDGLSPVIFDADGSIIDAHFGEGAHFDILGIAGIDTPVGAVTQITEASIIINGAFFDGVGLPASPEDVTRTGLKAAIVHEIGHFINLDHSVLNHELAFDGNAGNDIYVPTMFPIAVDDEAALASTNPDDELAALNLYPAGAPANSLSGGVRTNSGTWIQGANVVFRKTDDPLMTAYSLISGGLWFPCNPASTCDPCNTACDPGNPAAKGAFAADHFAPGDYMICVEQIDTRFSSSNASFVGPLATPAILTGPEECFNLAEGPAPADDPDDVNAVTAGSATPIEFVLNVIPGGDPFEPNNTLATGAPLMDLPGGQDTVHSLLSAGDLDVFDVPLVAGQRVRVDIDAAELGSSLDAVVGFYDASDNLVALVDDANDPDSGQFTLDPALELIANFTGTGKVVVSSYPDTDQNGVGGVTTGGYWIRVEVANDTDGDGAPDPEDICPASARDDADRDGVCFGADNCPNRANPLQAGSTKLNGALVTGGSLDGAFSLSPDAAWVVYRGDQDADDVVELYSVPIGGGTPIKLNGAPVSGGDVTTFLIAPNSSRVVYLADQDADEVFELYSVPIGGGTPTKLSGALVTGGDVLSFGIASNSASVVYRADQDADEVVELYSVPIGGGTPTKLNGTMVAGGDVPVAGGGGFAITPNALRVVYRADQDADEVFELYSVPIGGGASIKLNGALVSGGDVIQGPPPAFQISPDSSRVIYRADQDTNEVFECYSVPIAGGAPVKLNGSLVTGGDVIFSVASPISPDSSRVIYAADQDTDGITELYSVPIGGGASTKLNGPMVAPSAVGSPLISPDGSRVLYLADQDTDGVIELYSVPIGGGTTIKLNGSFVTGGSIAPAQVTFAIAPDNSRVVYRADQDTDEVFELYSVPFGGGTSIKLNGSFVAGGDIHTSTTEIRITPDSSRVVYRADQDADEVGELYSVPLGGGASIKLNGSLVAGGAVDSSTTSFLISADSSRVVYCADQETDQVLELYSVDAISGGDTDADGVLNGCDICPNAANAGQDDSDGNGVGDACQGCAVGSDLDADGICGGADNCPDVTNVNQADFDADGAGNACDADDDNDGLQDTVETNTGTYLGPTNTGSNPLDADTDNDGVSDGDEVTGGTNPNVSASVSPGVSFHAGRVITATADLAVSVFAADVDGDGDTDVLSASYLDDKIAWYENDGASPPAWTPRTISVAANNAVSVFAADVDGDGDTDVISASFNDDKIAWYESNGASPPSWTARTVTANADGAYSVFAADLDGDGDRDVVSASYNDDKIAWYENNGASPPVWTAHTISSAADGARSVFSADVDGDGDVDVLSASYLDDKIAWYENDGGSPPAWTARTISTAADSAVSVVAADVDGDGDVDALSASYDDDKIAWYENNGASPPAWTTRIISSTADGAYSVFGTDVDGDGDTDVLSASINDNKIAWYENDGASPPIWAARVLSTSASGARSVFAADVDGDGDTDVLSASEADDKITSYENERNHRNAAFPAESLISSGFSDWINSIVAVDVDGDGDTDALSASSNDDRIAWYESNGASPPTFTARTIAVDVANGARTVFASDLDGDGDTDALSASWDLDESQGRIAWFENNGASPPAWTSHPVVTTVAEADPCTNCLRPEAAVAADVDGDGDQDIVAGWSSVDPVVWYENLDGAGTFGPAQVIYQFAGLGILSVVTADVDGDGDTDVISGSRFGNKTAWYENDGTPGGLGDWAEHRISFPAFIASVFAADVDGDGDVDVVSSSDFGDEIAWYENDGTPAVGGDWTARHIATLDFTRAVFVVDMDGDGDMDALSASDTEHKIAWYENDGASPPTWTEHAITTSLAFAVPVSAADMDKDGDADVLCAEWLGKEIVWYDNRGGQFALATTSLAPATIGNGATVPMLAIDVSSHGRGGDHDIELATLELLVTDSGGVSLSTEEANRLIERVRVYLDNGSSVFELGSDTLVNTIEDLALAPLVIPFATGDPRVRLAPGQSKRLFVAVETTVEASAQSPNAFRLTHDTQGSSKARDTATGALLQMQYAANVATPTITTIGDVSAPFVTGVFPPSGAVDVASHSDVVVFLSEPIDRSTVDLGVTLSTGGVKIPGKALVSDDGRTVSFDPDGPLALGGDFELKVSPALRDRSGNAAIPFVSVFEATSDPGSGTIDAGTVGESSGGTVLEGGNANDNSGFSAAALADVNATAVSEGISDLIVGAPNADAGAVDAGEARLVFGAPGLQSSSGTVVGVAYRTGVAGDFIGETVARAGDLDADGIQDFLIGAPRSDQAATDAGVVYLVFGDAGIDELAPGPLDLDDLAACTLPTLCGVKFLGEASGDNAGVSLSFAGDIDADGFDDLLVGAPGADPVGRADAGKVYLIYGPLAPGTIALSAVGSTTRGLVFRGESAGDRVGTSVSQWEDRNSDGIDDLLLGAPGATSQDEFGALIPTAGYVYAIQGGTLPGRLDDGATPGVIELSRVANGASDQVAGMVFLGSVAGGEIGRSLTGAIDMNGDGVDDILIAGNGVVFAIPGDGPKVVIGSTETGGRGITTDLGLARSFGALNAIDDLGAVRYLAGDSEPLTVGPAGDLNRDGFDDFVIGAPQADGVAGVDSGRAYVVLGAPASGDAEPSLADVGDTIGGFVVEGAGAGDNLGASVGGGFDLNADGVEDGLVGAPFADTDPGTPPDAGETYVISPLRPDEVVQLMLQSLGGGSVRLEWSVTELTASYNLYRGLVSTLRSAGRFETSGMSQLACGHLADADADQLPDFDDPAAAPAAGDAFVYLVTARNVQGEGPLGFGTVPRVNDTQCP